MRLRESGYITRIQTRSLVPVVQRKQESSYRGYYCSGWACAHHLPAVLQRVATKPDTLKIPAAPRAVFCTGTPILTACASSAPQLSCAIITHACQPLHASAHAPFQRAMEAPQLLLQGARRTCPLCSFWRQLTKPYAAQRKSPYDSSPEPLLDNVRQQ